MGTTTIELNRKLASQQNLFIKGNLVQEASTHVSFIVPYKIAKPRKLLSDGEF